MKVCIERLRDSLKNIALNKILRNNSAGGQNRSKLLSGESFCLVFSLACLSAFLFQKLDLEQIPRNGVDSFLS